MIMPYLRDMINDHKTTETQSKVWKNSNIYACKFYFF